MDPQDARQDPSHCACCIETRTSFFRNCRYKRNCTPPPRSSQTSCAQRLTALHSGSLTSAFNFRWQLFLQFTLLMMLLGTGLIEASCLTGEPHIGYLPAIRPSQLKLQRTTSAAECADECCLKRYCDLAWIIHNECYHARCLTESDCTILNDAADSNVVYLMERRTHSDNQDHGVECNPNAQWDTCPVSEHCHVQLNQCVCNRGFLRNAMTGRCEPEDRVDSENVFRLLDQKQPVNNRLKHTPPPPIEPWDSSDSNNLFGKHKLSESYNPDNPYGGISEGALDAYKSDNDDSLDTHDGESIHGDEPDLDSFRFCDSEDECDILEFCFGLHQFGEGICKCKKGYHMSEAGNTCIRESLEGDPIAPSSFSPSTEPTTGSENAPTATPPNASADTLPKTPSSQTPDTEDFPDAVANSSNPERQPNKGVGSEREDSQGEQGGGGAKGGARPEVGGLDPGGGVEMPHKKTGEEGSGHQGYQSESTTSKESNPPDISVATTPLPDTPTQDGDTQIKKGVDALTEKALVTEVKSKVQTQMPTLLIPALIKLTVSAGKDKTLQLPDQEGVSLIAYVIPEPPIGQAYTYEWQVLERPDDSRPGEMVGEHAKELKLDKLSAGVYKFKVEVLGEGSYGSATVNVTVIPPPRVNTPPQAVINPPSQEVILPNPDTFLDGSDSTDDDKIVSYHWEEIEGPVRETRITGDTQTLKLTDLVPGPYVIRLTVTDSDGFTDSALANITVKEEIDNPPVAKAGKDVIIKLPVNSAVLYGNSSFDDHPGMVYEWSKVSGPVADMSGSSAAILHLNSLEEGTYIFRLTVTDSKDRKDSDEATVIVKPENNLPPTANAGPDKELSLPDDSTTLDGTGSADDLAVTSYLWEKVSGPNDPEIKGADDEVATVSGLVAGHYLFKLTVGDKQGATDSDTVDVVVKKETNIPPVAIAGPDITIHLPNNVVELDGSESSDDKAIVSYDWKRSPKSPAAGSAAANSAHEPILKLTGLVAGVYHMTLNVTDAKGASNTDTAVVTVVKDPHRLNLVEITFDVEVSRFTQQDKIDMARSLAVLLSVRDGDISIQQVYQTPSEQLQVIFYATNATSNSAIPGRTVVKILAKKKLSSETDLLKFRVLEVDTMICQNNCSGHGECNPYTKLCICESFWMENYFRSWLGDKESNCDWSILYVIIVACVIAIAFVGLCWICICCIKRSRRKVKRRRRYNLLSQDLDGMESMEMLPKNGNGKQSSSIMISESDDDTDEETTLFDSKKRQGKNGKANGSIMTVQPRKKRPFPLISSRTEKM